MPATRLTWLPPRAASLVALARRPALDTWTQVRTDPGCVLLLARHTPPTLSAATPFSAVLRDAAVLEDAARLLGTSDGAAVDWDESPARTVHEVCLRYAATASRLARLSNRIDPETAWTAGLTAPLGWLAMCHMDAGKVAACLADTAFSTDSSAVQRRLWGYDQAGIARRLARRWRLPPWLVAVVGHLALPVEMARSLGADPDLFLIVQLAVQLVQRQQVGLGLPVGTRIADAAAALRLATVDTEGCRETSATVRKEERPLLVELLSVAAENRRLTESPILARLECDVDQLHRALEEQRGDEAARLHSDKLETLAEFAAGAGHEINNPLAVISGQAQYLLGYESDVGRQKALQKIIGQTQRIHDMLTELMQFARPPKPQKRPIDLASLLREVTVALGDLAAQRQVRLACPEPDQPLMLNADPRQLRTALTCLLRNAIEAAPAEGWAGVRVQTPTEDRVEVLIEDSGPGPTPAQREHMFDPFYSGRQAGRGRGMGLPTAWRLAREHGGDVYFDESSGGPTRFVLVVPREAGWNGTFSHAEAG